MLGRREGYDQRLITGAVCRVDAHARKPGVLNYMTPCFIIGNHAYSRDTHMKFVSNEGKWIAVTAQGFNLYRFFFGNLMHAMFRALIVWIETSSVKSLGKITKIYKSCVCAIFVFVVTIFSLGSWTNKYQHHKAMQKIMFWFPIFPQIDSRVSSNNFRFHVFWCAVFFPGFRQQRPHSSQVANFVSAFVFWDWLPNFNCLHRTKCST